MKSTPRKQSTKKKAIKSPSTSIGIVEVAKRAGVGIGSVSRVFSGHRGVSEQMRRRVLRAAESLDYAPNMLAQALRHRRTRSVGFVVSDIANPLVASIVHGAEAVLSAEGYSVLLTNSGNRPSVDAERIRLLQQRQVDGLILLPAAEDHPGLLEVLDTSPVPLVVIDRDLPATVKARYVLSDHYTGVGAAARSLLQLGHRRIALIVGPDVRPSRERTRAVTDAYASKQIKVQLIIDRGPLSIEHASAALAQMLDTADPPTAIILGGNQLLEGALAVIRDRNLRLGSDLSLVSCDDIPLGRFYETPVSSVMRDTDLIGRSAARLLLESMNDPQSQLSSVMLPTWYEARPSCGSPRLRGRARKKT
jgi:LacI family transcriptional regulator